MKTIIKRLTVIALAVSMCLSLTACGQNTNTVDDTTFKTTLKFEDYVSDGVANFIGLFEDTGLTENNRELMGDAERYVGYVPDTDAAVKLISRQAVDDGNYEFYTLKFVTSDGTEYTFNFTPGESEDLSINVALSDDVENCLIPSDAFKIYAYAAEQLSEHSDSIDMTPFENHKISEGTYQF